MVWMRTKPAVAVAIALSSLGVAGGQEAVTLRIKPPVGRQYRYAMVMDNKTSGMGGTGAMSMKVTTELVYSVKARKGTNTTMETRTTSAKVTAAPGSPMAGMAAQFEKQLRGQTMTVTLDELGKMVSAPGSSGATMAAGANTSVEYPRNPVKVGTTWSAVVDMGRLLATQGLKVNGGKIPFRYKVAKIESVGGQTLVHLSQSAKGNFTTAATGGPGPMKIGLDSSTAIVVEAATGMLRSSKGTMTMTLSAGSMTMTQTMVVDMRLK